MEVLKLATIGTMCIENNPKKQTLSHIIPNHIPRKKRNPLHESSRLNFHEDRFQGTTTAIAFERIAEAIRNPYKWIQLIDHHDSIESHKRLLRITSDFCVKLELKCMFFKQTGNKFYIAFGDPKK
jgi:hypothetical protein